MEYPWGLENGQWREETLCETGSESFQLGQIPGKFSYIAVCYSAVSGEKKARWKLELLNPVRHCVCSMPCTTRLHTTGLPLTGKRIGASPVQWIAASPQAPQDNKL